MTELFGFITLEMFWNQGVISVLKILGLVLFAGIVSKAMDWAWLRLLELNVYLKKLLKRWHGRH